MSDATEAITALLAGVRRADVTAPDGSVPVERATTELDELVTRVDTERARVALTTGIDEPRVRAILLSPKDWEDMRDALELARNEISRLRGTGGATSHEDLLAELHDEGSGA